MPVESAQSDQEKTLKPSAKCARKSESNMALRVAVRDGVIQRMTQGYKGMDRKRLFKIDLDSAKQAWANGGCPPRAMTSGDCHSCRHRHCDVCDEYSLTKQYSDYWICHDCGALSLRIPRLHLREVSNGLGEN